MSGVVRRDAARGFTLLELLVAMTIFAMTALLVVEGLRLGIHSWRAVDTRSDGTEHMRLVLGFVRAQLEQAQAPTMAAGAGVRQVDFAGTMDRLSWIAPFPGYLPQGGLYRFTLTPDEGLGEKRRLLLHYERYQVEGWERFHAEEGTGTVVLHEDVASMELGYWGMDGDDGRWVWQDEWVERDRLPALVRLRLKPRSEPRPWPELLVAPRLAERSGVL